MSSLRLFSSTIFCVSSLIICALLENSYEETVRPNIVLIVADDLGWNDVSFHGSDQIQTPNIDLLAYTGVALERYYSHCVCTPSRSALLTGKFAHTIGMQGYPLTNGEDRGLPLKEKLLPQYLKELGYATHLVGKWHVGGSRNEYLPTYRGFDTHFGCRNGFIDYYEYTAEESWSTGKVSGLELHRNLTIAWDAEGYVTDLYTNEAISIIKSHDASTPLFLTVAHNAPHSGNAGAVLQSPPDVVRTMRHVESPERRIFAAMVKKLDDSVGDIVKELLEKTILDKTIIVFISDNGGMTSGNSINYASNWPLRGLKMSPFEGGVRVVGLLWSPLLNPTNNLWKGYFHVVDMLPTLLGAVGADIPTDIDGINFWDNFSSNNDSGRKEFFEIDDYQGFASITQREYKLVTGTPIESYSDYQGADLRGIIGSPPSYFDSIKKCSVYEVLNKIRKPFEINDTSIRNKMKIDCFDKENKQQNICYSSNDTYCLFNIKDDPCEMNDLSETQPDVAERLLKRLLLEKQRVIPRVVPLYRDPRAMPSLHNYSWTTWANDL